MTDGNPVIPAAAGERYMSIVTPLGRLYGRDTVYLDGAEFSRGVNDLTLRGGIMAQHADEPVTSEVEVPYVLAFRGILALQMVEEDSARHPVTEDGDGRDVFIEVLGSAWVRALGGKVMPGANRHFILHTYDETFEVVCLGFDWQLPSPAPESAG